MRFIAKSAEFISAVRSGELEQLFPGVQRMDGCSQPVHLHAEGDALQHVALVVEYASTKRDEAGDRFPVLWAAAAVHDIEKPATRAEGGDGKVTFLKHAEKAAERCAEFAHALGFTPEQAASLEWVVRHHMDAHMLPTWGEGKRVAMYRHADFPLLALLQEADARASWRSVDGSEHAEVLREFYAHDLAELEARERRAQAEVTLKNRVAALLRAKGVSPGPRYGEFAKAAVAASREFSDDELEAFVTERLG